MSYKIALNLSKLSSMLVMVYTVLILQICSQNICSNCVDPNSLNFTCNNIGCQGFMLTKQQNTLLNGGQLNINCVGGGSTCYYSSSSPVYSQSYYIYLFCNYTFPGCSTCSNDQTCKSCQNGYLPVVSNPILELYSCQYCQDIIGGCQSCSSLTTCQQCNAQYLNVFGLCYSRGGNIIGATTKPWNKNGSTPTQIITAVQLFIGCIIIILALYRICSYKQTPKQQHKGQQKVKLQQGNKENIRQNIYQNRMNQKQNETK